MLRNKDKGIFIYGYYGYSNFGDDLLVKTVIDGIRKYDHNGMIYIRNLSDIKSIRNIDDNKIVLTNIDEIIVDNSKPRLFRFFKYMWEYNRFFGKTKLLILGGGTLLHDSSSRYSLLMLSIIITLARIRGLKIIGMGIGISTLEKDSSRYMLRYIIKVSNMFYLRDEAAIKEAMLARCDKNKFQLSSDLVYSTDLFVEKTKVERSQAVAISIVGHVIENNTNKNMIINNLVMFIEKIIADGYKVKLLTFQELSYNNIFMSDNIINKEIIERIDSKIQPNIELCNMTAEPKVYSSIYEDIDVIISMRFHGLVLAAMKEIPFIGLVHDNKVSEICQEYKMPFIGVDRLDYNNINDEFERAKEIIVDRNILINQIKRSQNNFDLIANEEW